MRALFEVARELGVKAMVMVDSDLRSIAPEWIELLAGPILKGGYDFVAPLYARYKYDGTITNAIAYPLTRALYGARIRQPIGGEFAVSGDLVQRYLELDTFDELTARFGIDVWMTHSAINEGFAVCQTRLGAKIHDAKDPAGDLGPMFRQVVGTLFGLAARYEDRWLKVRGSHSIPEYGFERVIAPELVEVNHAKLVDNFETARLSQADAWGQILSAEQLDRVMSVEIPERAGRLPLPGRPVDPLPVRRPGRLQPPRDRPRAPARRADPALLRADRRLHRRDDRDDHRPGGAGDRGGGARVRGAQAVPGHPLARDARPGGRLMAPRRRQPYRILLPLANPRTARDLVRIGAGVGDGRRTEITALGIVEVPEGVSLSEGATHARTARRLLQRVLDFGDEEEVEIRTMVRIGRRAADGVIEAVGEESADLVIFGWGGPPSPAAARRSRPRRAASDVPSRPSSRRPSMRWCGSPRRTSRSSSSVASTTSARSWCRCAAVRTPSWRCGWPATWASASGRRWW